MSLQIAPNLLLPLDAVTQKIALLGMSGSGKTHAMTKLAEGMLDARAQLVVIDPKGEAWGLRLLTDGKRPGYSIPVFGGAHGDVPLRADMGGQVAELIVRGDYSAVLDLSEFIESELARFGYDFATRLLHLKKQHRSAMCVMVDEAQDFIPQNPQPASKGRENYEPRMLHAFQRLQKQGRATGIGLVIAGQRPQEINKKVLNLCECWITFRMAGLQERKTTVQIIGEKDREAASAIDEQLPRLDTGTAYVWSAAWLKVSGIYHILQKKTFDSSATPAVGARKVEPRQLSPVDVRELTTAMHDVIEKAKADDPKMLRQRVAELEREVVRLASLKNKLIMDQSAIDRAVRETEERLARRYESVITGLQQRMRAIDEAVGVAANRVSQLCVAETLPALPARTAKPTPPKVERIAPPSLPPRPASNGHLPKGELAVLTVAAQYPDGATREQITILTGYKRSSRDAYLQRLRTSGHVEQRGDVVVATDTGINALGSDFEPLPTGEALQEYWLERLPEGERKFLRLLLDAYPNAVTRQKLSDATEYQRSSRDAYLQRLKARKLIVVFGGGEVKASDVFFEG